MATASNSLILDNGAASLKVGLASAEEPLCVPNCITRSKTERRKSFIGNQIDEIKDLSSLFYLLPFQRGYLINWDTQRQIWDHTYQNLLTANPPELNLLITEPPFNFPSIRDALYEVLFEEYGFSSLCVTLPATLSAGYQIEAYPDRPCCLVVDCGYSFTHILPFYRGKVLLDSVLRIDVGGKVLTNHLKDVVSYRQLNVMDETYVMNQVKEEVCFVSQDLYSDMNMARKKGAENEILREYVLPDFSSVKKGYTREVPSQQSKSSDEQTLRLTNERFSIPEILFHPSDIGIRQMGIPEAIVQSISGTPKPMHSHLYGNVLLTGGSTRFPGFRQRVLTELRKLAPDRWAVDVTCPDRPDLTPWFGGQKLVQGLGREEEILQHVTLAEYKENGNGICYKRFHENQTLLQSTSN